MATTRARVSSFSRNVSTVTSQNPGVKHGPNGTMLISSGIPDLDSNYLFDFLLTGGVVNELVILFYLIHVECLLIEDSPACFFSPFR